MQTQKDYARDEQLFLHVELHVDRVVKHTGRLETLADKRDVPMSKEEAKKTLREMFEDPDWDIDQIARYCKFNFARCYKGGYPALIKLAKSIGKGYVDKDELENWFW